MSNQLKIPPDIKPQADIPIALLVGSLPFESIHFLISSKHWSMPQLAMVAWPGRLVAFVVGVLPSHFDRVEAEVGRDPFDLLLGTPHGLGSAEAAHRGRRQGVRVDPVTVITVAFLPSVREGVEEPGQVEGRCAHASVGAAVREDLRFPAHEGSVLLTPVLV